MTVFVDLDGVLVNFIGPMSKFLGIRMIPGVYQKIDYRQWKRLRETHPLFWHQLPVLTNAAELWKLVRPYHPSILTAAPPEWPEAEVGKRAWVKQHLPKFGFNPAQQVYVVERHQKQAFAMTDGRPNLLIDDYDQNITEWEAAGGVGVLYTPDAKGLAAVGLGLQKIGLARRR